MTSGAFGVAGAGVEAVAGGFDVLTAKMRNVGFGVLCGCAVFCAGAVFCADRCAGFGGGVVFCGGVDGATAKSLSAGVAGAFAGATANAFSVSLPG